MAMRAMARAAAGVRSEWRMLEQGRWDRFTVILRLLIETTQNQNEFSGSWAVLATGFCEVAYGSVAVSIDLGLVSGLQPR
jgi:hypothetical protein